MLGYLRDKNIYITHNTTNRVCIKVKRPLISYSYYNDNIKMICSVVIFGVIFVLLLIYLNGKYNEHYWKKRKVTFYSKNKVIGPFWDFLTTNRPMFEVLTDLYKKYPNEPAIAIGSLLTPTLYVIHPENVQHVLQSDFHSFHHRGVDINEGDLLADNILLMNGVRWKLMRQNMTPLFTSTKLKSMYYIVEKSAQDFVDFLKENPKLREGNSYETLSTFCSGAIAAAVFGIGTKSIFDSPFLEMAKATGSGGFLTTLKFSVANVSPWIFKTLGLKIFAQHEKFFIGAIKQLIRNREQENTRKHDFADICVSLQKTGTMIDHETGYKLDPTDEILAAQAFFFFIAGVEPTATSIFATLFELGRNPEILQRVHNEIDNMFEQCNGQLSYDAVMEMKYIDNVMNEALRMYPPIGFLTRLCVKDTVLPVGNIKVEKGTKMFTPIFEIQRDERYYPNPDVFDPERFSNDSKHEGNIASYMPFGKGNRTCIGERYARIQAKVGLVHVLRHFTVKSLVPDSGIEYKKEQVQVRLKNVDVIFTSRIV